jgi:hypothetical protein
MNNLKTTIIAAAVLLLFRMETLQAQKAESSIQLSFIKKNDNSKLVSALVMGKNKNNKFLPAVKAHISFYISKEKELVLLSRTTTDGSGKTSVTLPKNLPLDADRFFDITVKLENDEAYEDADEQLHLKEVDLTTTLNQLDTARIVTATVTELTADGSVKAIKDVPVNFYVQRLFGNMPAAEDHTVNTDEKGSAVFIFPKNVPGDTVGNITIVSMIEGNDTYGTVESKKACMWGKAIPLEKDPFPRAMWAPRAPWALIITLTTLYGGVWSAFFFMFLQLRKIKKEGDLTVKINN